MEGLSKTADIKTSLSEEWVSERYNDLARSGHFPDDTYLHRDFLKTISSKLSSSNFDRVLDAGSGAGYFGIGISGKARSLVFLDISFDALLLAKQRCAKGSFILGNIESMPFDSETFDLVLCVFVMSHVNDPNASIKELGRVTSYGGCIVISFENRYWHVLSAGITEDYNYAISLLSSPNAFFKVYDILPHVRLYSLTQINEMCHDCNLKIEHVIGFRHIVSLQEKLKGIGTTETERLMYNSSGSLSLENMLTDTSELLCIARHYLVFCRKV